MAASNYVQQNHKVRKEPNKSDRFAIPMFMLCPLPCRASVAPHPRGTRKEAWDLPVYWTIAYPAMIASAFVLGLIEPSHPVRWGLCIALGQGVWSLLVTAMQQVVANLLPPGLMMLTILSVPYIVVAWIVRKLGF